jgi:hypothetical protein
LVAAHTRRRRKAAVDDIRLQARDDRNREHIAIACASEGEVDHRVRSRDRSERTGNERLKVSRRSAFDNARQK